MCCSIPLSVRIQPKFNKISENEVIKVFNEPCILRRSVPRESIKVPVVRLCLNITDGLQPVTGDKVRSPDLIQCSRFLCKGYCGSLKMVNDNTLKERLEMRKEGQLRCCIGAGLGAVDIL